MKATIATRVWSANSLVRRFSATVGLLEPPQSPHPSHGMQRRRIAQNASVRSDAGSVFNPLWPSNSPLPNVATLAPQFTKYHFLERIFCRFFLPLLR